MTCAHCQALEARLALLTGVEAIQGSPADRLRRRYRMTPGEARLTVELFRSEDALGPCELPTIGSASVLKVYVHSLREVLGPDAIETVRAHGYRLTQAGRQRVAAAIEQQQSAA